LVVAGLAVVWVIVNHGFGAWGRVRVIAVGAEPTESDAGVGGNAVEEVEVCGGAELVHQGIGERA
jgi:hypothetical protein